MNPKGTSHLKGSKPLIVIVRGPMGAGKTSLMQGLAHRSPYHFYALDTDAATGFHPQDPHGENLDTEWYPEIDIVTLHARIILGRGLNLVLDPGLFLTVREVDRFLRGVGRSRNDPRVILIRLTVAPKEAARRKSSVARSYVYAAHRGWQPKAIPGELVIPTEGKSRVLVQEIALRSLRDRIPES